MKIHAASQESTPERSRCEAIWICPLTSRQVGTATGWPSTDARGQSCTRRPRRISIDESAGPFAARATPAVATRGAGGGSGSSRSGVGVDAGRATGGGVYADGCVGAGVGAGGGGAATGGGG